MGLWIYAGLRLDPVIPPTTNGVIQALALISGLSILALLPSATLLGRRRRDQLVYGTSIITITAFWTQFCVPASTSALRFCTTATIIVTLLQAATWSLPLKAKKLGRSGTLTLSILGMSLICIPTMLKQTTHPGDRAWISLIPFTEVWLPAPKLAESDVKVLYPPNRSMPTATLKPHVIFILTDQLSTRQAESYVEVLPTSCTVLDNHLTSEDPADGAFNLAFSLESFHRKPFRYSGQVPFAFNVLDSNGYARHSLATRGLYENQMLEEWGHLELTSPTRLATLAEKRLGDRKTRPIVLSIFPGDPARNHKLIERLADYIRVDTVLFITGLSGPIGRTAFISCAPVRWSSKPTNHTQVMPTLLNMMGIQENDWHTPIDSLPILASSDFPFTRADVTIFQKGTMRTAKLCAPDHICFVPEEEELMGRLTRFMKFP